MSRNFDVLMKAERESDIFEPSAVRPEIVTSEPAIAPVHIDSAVHDEEMRLVQRVFLLENAEAPHVVVFCGIDQSGGSVGICARAAENLADQTGLSVCLVDGNLGSPSLHRYFGEKNSGGVADAIVNPKPVRKFVRQLEHPNVFLLPAGAATQNARATWKSDRWRCILSELREEFPFVLISGPPAVRQVENVILGQMSDGIVLILEANQTRRETARTVKQTLAAANVKVLGAVLNNRTFSVPESIYRWL